MKKLLVFLAAIVMMAGISSNVSAQTSATVTGTTAGAVLIVPMTLTQTSPLHFGTINVLAGLGGTVILSTANVRTPSANLALSPVAPVSTNAAYNVTGTYNTTYALTLPATITVTHTITPASTMTIGALTARFFGAGADAITSILSASGTDSFTVGGTLTIAPAQLGGIYAGTFNVTVDYN
jgi:hypothetical protein